MRYEVAKQINEIDKAIAIFEWREIPDIKQPTEEEMEDAIKKATACMTLIVHILSQKDMTMKELNLERVHQETLKNL